MIIHYVVLSFLLGCNFVFSAVPADKITSLPYLNGTLGNQYSGYVVVDATAGRRFHYWFVESSAQSPSTAPLVLWLNGGPGCSSMDGFLYENGPWKFDTSSSTPSLINNPYSWHLIANMLFLESPAGVGFSYSSSSSDYSNQNDDLTSLNNYNFLKAWLKLYPEYMNNNFWITGESYGGIYVPSLANRVLGGILDKSFVIPFKGIMVGNGVVNSLVDDITKNMNFLFGHGIISNLLYTNIIKACTTNPPSSQCNSLKTQARAHMNDIDVYNLYADCYHQRSILDPPTGVPPCTDAYYSTLYLNENTVKSAIHVNPAVTWSICSTPVGNSYNRTRESMIPIHKKLIQNGIRVLIYSGDSDFSVPYTDSEYWTSEQMGLTPSREWQAWYYTDTEGQQVAGFVTDYPGGFTFATIKGSGHMYVIRF